MKVTKRRIHLHVTLNPAVKVDLEAISHATGIRSRVIVNRVLGWAMAQSQDIRERILHGAGAEDDAEISKLILRDISRKPH